MNDYFKGKSLLDKDDFDGAKLCFKSGISKGDARCYYGLLAANAVQGNDLSEYLTQLSRHFDNIRALFDDGDADAAFILGRCYETGTVVPQDIHTAIRYYSLAKDRGNSDAMFNLGCILISFGIDEQTIAEKYFLPAAKLNNPNACFALGHFYHKLGNHKLSSQYYKQAADYLNHILR